jgi:hypothetical protein
MKFVSMHAYLNGSVDLFDDYIINSSRGKRPEVRQAVYIVLRTLLSAFTVQ